MQAERYVVKAIISRRRNEWGEYVVRAYDQHGKRYAGADYFTNDRADAEATADSMMLKNYTLD